MNKDVTIENRAHFIANFHENVPFQSNEYAEDQLQWMAVHAHEYPDSQIWMGMPGGMTASGFPRRFLFSVYTTDGGNLIMTYTNVTDEGEED
ncbi:hypothetical protein LC1981_0483 [Lacticaseibacillus paracasei NRIC 1981]|uniref:hypothetical protein n=1 Tax=Lacticaseibacillus paracasei TaxID=1597 RepID=UPI0005DCA527|nr:hypothetical protein [Lacticaseibacillus paracasei]GAN41264.1 hypothetical protein LC1981_0483 [Lacticaseibacillus paracasei NRIC 1981]